MDKVLIAPMTLASVNGAFVQALRDAGFELIYPNRGWQLNEEELLEFLPGIKASLAGSEPYTAHVLAANPQLRVIARAGVGYDAVDVAAATKHGTAVAITPGTNEGSVAEHTFALILGLAKNIISQHHGTRTAAWPRGANLPLRGQDAGHRRIGTYRQGRRRPRRRLRHALARLRSVPG
jgi:phosphoglycerate dehydrogenase-like enzyme